MAVWEREVDDYVKRLITWVGDGECQDTVFTYLGPAEHSYQLEATVDKFNDTINSGNGLVARLKLIKNVNHNCKGQNLPAAFPL
jgi:hypothetical protein